MYNIGLFDMPKKDEIRKLLKRLDGEPADSLESETLEFKPWDRDVKSLHRVLRETVVCLANARGGTIVLGVRDKVRSRREAIQGVGTYDPHGIRRAVYDGTEPHLLVEIEELQEPEGTLLLVQVPKGIPPHTTSDGVAKIRVGKECKPLTGKTITQLLAGGGQRDLTAEVVQGCDLKDIDTTEIATMRKLIERIAQNPELARMEDRALLEAMGLLVSEELTFAGILLLGRKETVAKYIPQHEIRFLRYRKATRYDQRKDLKGPLLSVLQEIEHLVSVNNRIRTVQEESFGQLELPDLSWEVAREGVLNAVTHRDYFLHQGVQVELYRDRLEISSPGGFIGGITPENILRHPPVHRNELLARTFQTVGWVNRVGIGVDRIYEQLLHHGKELPRYSGDESHVRLVVPLKTHDNFALFVFGEERRDRSLDLDDLILLRSLVKSSALDRWSAATVLQLNEEEAAEKLIRLREAGYLAVRGRGRGARYDLKRELAYKLREKAAVDAQLSLDEEGVRLRILALLRERGRLTNAEIQRFSGYNRMRVYRLVKELERQNKVKFIGKGRGAHIVPVGKK